MGISGKFLLPGDGGDSLDTIKSTAQSIMPSEAHGNRHSNDC